LLPLSSNPVKAETSTGNTGNYEAISDRLNDLENRVKRLEQGLDERVIEYNMVHSALMYMIVDNKLGWTIPNCDFTNDMRQFPSPKTPLYGFDKNKDGIPDTNYLPFQTTKWFYATDNNIERPVYQIPDPKLFIVVDSGTGKTEALATELHNIQTAVMALLADSKAGVLDTTQTNISDMDLVTADASTKKLSSYLTGLNPDGTVKSGCRYDFSRDGTVTQRIPPDFTPATIVSPQKNYEAELHDIQTAVMAMLADSTTGYLTAGTGISQIDMHNVQAKNGNTTLYLSDYLVHLVGTSIPSGCKYTFTKDGTVTQTKP
jgi:hypothetical protein